MKIEIDLNDILSDDYGTESLQESVRRQVIDSLTKYIKDGIGKRIQEETSRVINEGLQAAVAEQMPALVADLLSAEYIPVGRYGERSGPTTFRAELMKTVIEQMTYKPARYDSEKNIFTKSVDTLVQQKMTEFQSAFYKQVDGNFIAEAMGYATNKLAERLKVKVI